MYRTTLDRAVLALAAGGSLGGVVALVLVAAGGHVTPLALLVGFLIGVTVAVMASAGIGAPLWLVSHALGRRGPRGAALIGGVAGLVLALFGRGLGYTGTTLEAPSALWRWAAAAAIALGAMALGAAIGLAMWRVAYRRVG